MMHWNIPAVESSINTALQAKIDHKTKPLGALGQLEKLALRIGQIQNTLLPQLQRPAVLVFAGDHGIVASGVSPYPQAVTQQMVLNFIQGGAAINVFARQHGVAVQVVDAGVNADFSADLPLTHAKIGKGTCDFLTQPAMTSTQMQQCLQRGREIAQTQIAQGSNVLAFGEMGIGNTSAAAALMAVLCQMPAAQCVGRGTGLDDAGLAHKTRLVQQAVDLHQPHIQTPYDALQRLGGFEIAMMCGAMLGAAEKRCILLVDGFIASAALLVASRIAPAVLDYCIFAHCSGEQGHRAMLAHLNAQPLLDIGLRLGEGTGAVLAYPLVQAAVNFLNEMASFESAGVSEKC